MLIGAHVSVANGLAAAVDYAASVGCESMQFFAKSPRRWEGPPANPEAGKPFLEHRLAAGIRAAFTHTAYLINLATPDEILRERSIAALADEIARARLLFADGVATHLGTDPFGNPESAADRIASAVQAAFDLAGTQSDSPTMLLLENTAGSGNAYGRTIGELAAVIDRAEEDSRLLGVCFDTCHAHASGIDLSDEHRWSIVLNEIENRCGSKALRLVHANDCVYERGSHRDRHAWIGDGTLGLDAFAAMVRHPKLEGVPAVMEMPGEIPYKDRENIRRLTFLRDQRV